MKITITGSLGHVGLPLTQILVAHGHAVTVISSNPSKQPNIESLGAQAAIGSVSDSAFLKDAFANADAVFCMVPPDFSQPDQVSYYEGLGVAYANAIVAANVKRVVHLSSYGAHLPSGTGFITGSYRVEKVFESLSGIQLTHVRPTYFYYNLLHFVTLIKTAGFIGAVYGGDDKLAMVSPFDIAAVAAEELERDGQPAPVRYVTSDDRTCNEVASILGKEIGIPDLKWRTLSKEDVSRALLKTGMPPNAVDNLVELGEAIHTGRLREDYEKHLPPFGTTGLETYAKEFARIFRAS